MLLKPEQPLILTSSRLFKIIAGEAEKVFPVKKVTWRVLSRAIAEAERSNGVQMDLVLVLPVVKENPKKGQWKRSSRFLSLFIDSIEGSKVKARILFPLYGEIGQQNKILRILLATLGINEFSVEFSGIAIEISLPFVPVEVKYGKANGHNGDGQQAFICPEEVILVT